MTDDTKEMPRPPIPEDAEKQKKQIMAMLIKRSDPEDAEKQKKQIMAMLIKRSDRNMICDVIFDGGSQESLELDGAILLVGSIDYLVFGKENR
jgi:hypothetical protein